MPDVSVVIPTRNRLPLLQEAVASVRAQTVPTTAIVVDDDSEDETWEWLRGQSDVRRVRLRERSERSTARNVGLSETETEHVLFLDDDDLLTPRAIERLVTARLIGGVGAAIGARVVFGDGMKARRQSPHPRRRVGGDLHDEALFGWCVLPGCVLFRRDVVEKAGGFVDGFTYSEDQWLMLLVTLHERIVLVPHEVMHYRVHPGSSMVTESWRTEGDRDRREAFVAEHETERTRALATIEASRSYVRARRLYEEGNYEDAGAEMRECLALAPWVKDSPIFGPQVRSNARKIKLARRVGPGGIAQARRARRALSGLRH